MTDDLPPLEPGLRALLDRAIDATPPSAAVKASLRARVAATITGGGGAAAAAAGASVKLGLLGLGSAGVVTTAWLALREPSQPPQPARTIAVATSTAPTAQPAPTPAPNVPNPPRDQVAATTLPHVAQHNTAAATSRPAGAVDRRGPNSASPRTPSPTRQALPTVPDEPASEPVIGADDAARAASLASAPPGQTIASAPPDQARASAPVSLPPRPPNGTLTRERSILEAARRALAEHAPRRALDLVRTHAAEFPDGVLVEEREVIAIQAAISAGDRGAARRRAMAFRQRYPNSIFRDLVDTLLRSIEAPS